MYSCELVGIISEAVSIFVVYSYHVYRFVHVFGEVSGNSVVYLCKTDCNVVRVTLQSNNTLTLLSKLGLGLAFIINCFINLFHKFYF